MAKLANFEIFEDTGKKSTLFASISSTGRIALNEGAVRQFELTKFKYVLQMYDREKKLIGLQFFDEKTRKGLVKLQFRTGAGVFFRAVNFLKEFAILPASALFYIPRRSEDLQNVLVIDLKHETERGYAKKNKKQN